jgi:hypothetical protein
MVEVEKMMRKSPFPESSTANIIPKILKKYLLGIFISRAGGEMLYSFQVDESIRTELIAQFIAALAMFGEENMGKISRIMIQGLDVEMSILSRYNLILTVLFKPNMVQRYLDVEAEKAIEAFYAQFKEPLEKGRLNQSIYQKFDKTMWELIKEYLVHIGVIKDIIGISNDIDFMVG